MFFFNVLFPYFLYIFFGKRVRGERIVRQKSMNFFFSSLVAVSSEAQPAKKDSKKKPYNNGIKKKKTR